MWVRRSTATLSSGWSSWRGGEAWRRWRSTRDQYTYFSWRRSVDFSSPARPAKPVFFAFCRSLYYLFLRQGVPDSAAQSTRDRQLDCIRMQAFIYSTATRLFKGLVSQDSASAYTDKNSKEKIIFSEKITENKLSEKSFVQKILQSLKAKMYKK